VICHCYLCVKRISFGVLFWWMKNPMLAETRSCWCLKSMEDFVWMNRWFDSL